MEKHRRQIIILVVAFFLSACSSDFKSLNPEESFSFKFNGFEKSLDYGSKKAFALVFFSKDCAVCKAQIPILENLAQAQNFDFFVVLSGTKDKQEATKWAEQRNLNLRIFYEDKASSFFSKAVGGIYGVPVIVFYDKNAKINEKFIGLTPEGILQNKIKSLKS